MTAHILVLFSSQGGSTAGIAEAIGQSLSAGGAQVDVCPVGPDVSLSGYQGVVIGSAVHQGKWMPEAAAFVERHQAELRRIPTAIFQVCLMLSINNESNRRMAPEWMAPQRARLSPVAEASFAGALWPDRYPKFTDRLGLRIFLAAIHQKAGDYRDWEAIRAWAESLRPLLIR